MVLQEIFGVIASEAETLEAQAMQWIFGLLCMIEKPLLPDQAGDLNMLLKVLRKEREANQGDYERVAQIDVNIAIITEYFD